MITTAISSWVHFRLFDCVAESAVDCDEIYLILVLSLWASPGPQTSCMLFEPSISDYLIVSGTPLDPPFSAVIPLTKAVLPSNCFVSFLSYFSVKIAHHYDDFSSLALCFCSVKCVIKLFYFFVSTIRCWCIYHYDGNVEGIPFQLYQHYSFSYLPVTNQAFVSFFV